MPAEARKTQSNYEGSLDINKMRIGHGVQKFSHRNEQETYNGRFFRDSYHGQGFYYTRPAFGTAWSYEGAFYANTKDGVGMISYGNNTYFIGLFKNDEAFGPGIWTESNGGQNIGFWKGSSLVRLIYPVGEVKQLSTSPYNKFRVLRYRRVINGNPVVPDYAAETMEQFHAGPNLMLITDRLQAMYCKNPQSHLFMRKQFDDVYMDDLIPAEVLFTLIRSVSVNTIDELREKLDEIAAPESEHSSVDRHLSEENKKNKKRKKGRKDSTLSVSHSDVDHTSTGALSKSQFIKRDTSKQDTESKMMLSPEVSGSLIISKHKSEGAMNIVDLSDSQSTLYLMAWNNSQIMVDMLMHAFSNRNAKCPIPMNFGLIMCGRREKFSSKKGYLEVMSKKFLKACSTGNIDMIKELAYTWRVDVNLTDSKGNSCLLRAVEADNHPLIKLLILYGADPDILNDEGFSTISHCLTRYLAMKRKIRNWGDAFLPPADFVPNANVQQWMFDSKNAVDMKSGLLSNLSTKKVRPSISEEYIFDFTPPTPVDPWAEIFHMLDKKQNKGAKKQKKKDKKDKKKMNKKLLYNEEILDDSESALDPDKRRSIRMSLDMATDEIVENKLATIEKTIQLLTNVGGNLNVSEVPAPVILLAILTGMKEIVEVLLEQGVDPNARLLKEQKSGNLTPMHVMVLSPPLQTYPDILKLLLKYGGNADLFTSGNLQQIHTTSVNAMLINTGSVNLLKMTLRTANNVRRNENFDMAAQDFLLGKLDRSLFEPMRGMTPIQTLCLRVDAERQQDILPILEEMLKILIPASVNSFRPSYRYLGHTPLTLAIARGNSLFVKLLLDTKEMVDPNEYLGIHLGNALAVLMRYLGVSPLFTTYQMLFNLLKVGANPLRKLHLEDGNIGNLFDFLKNLQAAMVVEFFEEMSKQGPSEMKKEAPPKNKKAKKKKENEKKSKVPTLSKDFQLKHAEFQCKMAILENTCRAKINRRIRGRLLKELLLKIQNIIGSIELHTALLVERMKLWFTPDTFVNTVKEGVALGNFCLSKADVDIALSILFPVVIKKHKQFKKDIKNLKKLERQQRQMKMDVFNLLENIFQYCLELKGDLTDTELKTRKKYNIRLVSRNTDLYPELDSSEDLYKVCYNCLQRNRSLEVCPRCGLVYFCCEFCNMLDVAREDPTGHICGIRFYGVTKPERLNLASIGLLRGKMYEDFKGSPWERDKIDINTLMEGRDYDSFLTDRADYFERFTEQEERRRIIMAEKEEQRQAYEKELEAIKAKLLAEEEAERRRSEKEAQQKLLKEEEMKEAELKMQQEKQRKEIEEEDKKEERERAIQQMLSFSQAKKEGLTDILEGIKEHSLGELQTLSDKLLELRGELSDEKLDELLLLSLLEGTGAPEEDKAKETEEGKVGKEDQLSEKEGDKDKSIEDKEKALKKKDTEKTKKEKEAKKEKDRQERERQELEKREKELVKARRERREKDRVKKEKERRDKFMDKAKKEKEKQQQDLEKAKKDRIKQLEQKARDKFITEKESKEEIQQPEIKQVEDETALEKDKIQKEKLETDLKKMQEQEALKDIAQLEKEAMQEVKEQERVTREKVKPTPPVKEKDLKAAKEKDVAKAVKEQPQIAMKTKEGLAKPTPPKDEQIPKKAVIITDKGEVKPAEVSDEVKAAVKAPEVKAAVKAPEVKAAVKAPEVKAAVKAPEVKAAVKAPEVKAAVKAPEVKADVKAPVVKAAVKAPEVKAAVKAPEVKADVKAVTDYKVDADKVIAKEPEKRVVPVKPTAKLKPRAIVPIPKTPLEVPKVKDVQTQEMKKQEPVLPQALAAEPAPEPQTVEVSRDKLQPEEILPKPTPTEAETLARPETVISEPAPKPETAIKERPEGVTAKPVPPKPKELITAKLEERPEAEPQKILVKPEPITPEALPAEPMPAAKVIQPPPEKLKFQPEEIAAKPAPPPSSKPAPTVQIGQPPTKELKARPPPSPSKAIRTRPAPKPKILQPTKQELRPQEQVPVPPETMLPEPVLKLKTVEPPREEVKPVPPEVTAKPAPVPPKVLPPTQAPVPKVVEPSREEVKPLPPEVTVKPTPVPPKVMPPTPAPVSKVVEPSREEVQPIQPEVTVKPTPVPPKVMPPTPTPVSKVVEPPKEEVKPRPPEVTKKPAPVPPKVMPPTQAPVSKVVEPPREEVKPVPPEVTAKPAPIPPKVLPPTQAPVSKVVEPPREEVKPVPPKVTAKPAPVPPKVLPPTQAPVSKVVEAPREEVKPVPPEVTAKPAPVPPKVLPPTQAPGSKVVEPSREEVKPIPPEVTVKPTPVPPKVMPPTPAPVSKVVEPSREEVKTIPPEVTVKPTPVPPKVMPPMPTPVSKVVEPPKEEVKPRPPEVTVKPAPVPPKVMPPTRAPESKVVEPPKEELKPRPPEVSVKPAPTPPKVLPPTPAPLPKVVEPTREEVKPIRPDVTVKPTPVAPKLLPPTPAPVSKVVEPPKEELKPRPPEVSVKPAPTTPKVLPPTPAPLPKVVEPTREEVKLIRPEVTVKPTPVAPKVLPPTPAPVSKVVEPSKEELKARPPEVSVKPAPTPPKVFPPTPAPLPKVVEPTREEVKPRPPEVTVKPTPVAPKLLPPTPAPVSKVVEPPKEELKPRPPEVSVKPAPTPPKVFPPTPAPLPKVVEPTREEVKPRPPEVSVKPAPVPSKVLPPTPAPVSQVVEQPSEEVKPTPPEVTVRPTPVPPKVSPPTISPVSKVVEPPREELKFRPPEVSVKPAPTAPKILPPIPAPVHKLVEPPREEIKPRPPEVTVKPAPVPPWGLPPTPPPVPKMVEPSREEVKRRSREILVEPAPVPPWGVPPTPPPVPKMVEPSREEVKRRSREILVEPAPVPPWGLPPTPPPVPKMVEPSREEVKRRSREILVEPAPVPPWGLPPTPPPVPKMVEPSREEVKLRSRKILVEPAPVAVPRELWSPEPEVWPKLVQLPREEVKPRPYEIPLSVRRKVLPPALPSTSRIIGPEEGVLEYLKQRAMKAKELPRFPIPKDHVPGVPGRKIPLSEIEIAGEPKEPLVKEIRPEPSEIKSAESISRARRPLKRRWEEVIKADKLEIPMQVMPDTALPFAYEPEVGITAEDLRRRLRLEEDIEGGYIIPVEGQELEVGKKIVKPLAGFIYRPIETYIIDYGEPKIKRARPSKKEKIMLEDFGRRPPFFHKFVSAVRPNVRYKVGKGYGVQYMINRLTGKPHRFIAWDELEKRFPEDIENLQGWAHIATEPPSVPERVAEEEFIPPYKEPSYEPFASFRFDRRGQFTWSEPPSLIKEEDMKNVPLHIQELMFRMASLLGPDADLGFLFPFVVIRNGELFYKFYGDKTIIENYSLN